MMYLKQYTWGQRKIMVKLFIGRATSYPCILLSNAFCSRIVLRPFAAGLLSLAGENVMDYCSDLAVLNC